MEVAIPPLQRLLPALVLLLVLPACEDSPSDSDYEDFLEELCVDDWEIDRRGSVTYKPERKEICGEIDEGGGGGGEGRAWRGGRASRLPGPGTDRAPGTRSRRPLPAQPAPRSTGAPTRDPYSVHEPS